MEYVMALIIEERVERVRDAMQSFHLVAKLHKLLKRWCRICKGLLAQLESRSLSMLRLGDTHQTSQDSAHLALMEGLGLDLPLLLQAVNNILVSPTDLVEQTLETHRVLYRPEGKTERWVHVP